MRLVSPALTLVFAIASISQVDARERRVADRKPTASERRIEGYYRRPSTVDHRGLCQRDTGKPFHDLNLNQQCDREEFWARFNDRGGDRGR